MSCHLSLKSWWLAVTSTVWFGTKLTWRCVCVHTRRGGGAKGASRRDRRERRRWEGGERRTKEEEAMYVTSSDILKVSYLDSSYRISDQLTSFLVNIFNSSSLHPAGVPYLCVIQHRHTQLLTSLLSSRASRSLLYFRRILYRLSYEPMCCWSHDLTRLLFGSNWLSSSP